MCVSAWSEPQHSSWPPLLNFSFFFFNLYGILIELFLLVPTMFFCFFPQIFWSLCFLCSLNGKSAVYKLCPPVHGSKFLSLIRPPSFFFLGRLQRFSVFFFTRTADLAQVFPFHLLSFWFGLAVPCLRLFEDLVSLPRLNLKGM